MFLPPVPRHSGPLLRWLIPLALLIAPGAHGYNWFYTVRPGDNLWTISETYLVSMDHWQPLGRLNRIADWSQPRYALDKRFVQLTLLVDKGEDAQGPRWESSRQFQDLREVLQETLDTPALVLLGPPGSGKSTLLRRLEWDLAVDALRDPAAEPAP